MGRGFFLFGFFFSGPVVAAADVVIDNGSTPGDIVLLFLIKELSKNVSVFYFFLTLFW